MFVGVSGPILGAGRKPNTLVVIPDQQFADAMSCRMGKPVPFTADDSVSSVGNAMKRKPRGVRKNQ